MLTTTFFSSPISTASTSPTKNAHKHPKTTTTISSLQQQNPITAISKFLWGPSLPPQLLISTVRSTWSATWQIMMSQLAPSDPSGSYTRPASQFPATNTLLSRPITQSLHLYAALPCPWAHRTLIVRALKGLENSVPLSLPSPGIDGSWVFLDTQLTLIPDKEEDELVPGKDNANGCASLREVYKMRAGGYSGRSTVPMLWDAHNKDVFCNESYDIIDLFNSCFNHVATNPHLDLSPVSLKEDIHKWNRIVYPYVNNGVYRCGFAQSQEAYDKAVNELFGTLDMIDHHLEGSRYLCGDQLTLADVCLFTTLIRFDVVYNVLFKCTKKKLVEYPNLHSYMRDIYQIPKVAATCNLEAVMDGYYKFLFPLNPGNIRPIMPCGCEHQVLLKPHNRESLIKEGVQQVYATTTP